MARAPTPSSPLMDDIESGAFELPDPMESIREIHTFVSGLTCRTHFTCNHASNYVPLKGNLPGARDSLLQALQGALDGRVGLKPEFLRGL